jgi:hypothetical protein
MVFTVAQGVAHIRHALHGDPNEDLGGSLMILNHAGLHLVNMCTWKFLERAPVTIGTVQDQAYVDLPSDFGEIIAIDSTEGLVSTIKLTTFQHLLEMRTNQVNLANFNYFGAIVWNADTSTEGGAPTVRVEIWPTPNVTDSDEFTLFYRAGWINLTEDTQYVEIPSYVEPLYIQLVRAHALGYEEEHNASMMQRLDAIYASTIYRNAMDQDQRVQNSYGPLMGGAARGAPLGVNKFSRSVVSGPS